MQLIGDGLAVLGSRLGLAWDPKKRESYLIRHGRLPGIPLEICAGVVVNGRTLVLPLTKEGKTFDFLDQDLTATTMSMSGIDPETGIHAKLTVRVPFRPRDERFSTVPAVFIEWTVERLSSNFRWVPQSAQPAIGKIFLKCSGAGFEFSPNETGFKAAYRSEALRPVKTATEEWSPEAALEAREIYCTDQLVALAGKRAGNRLEEEFCLERGAQGPKIALAWCAYDQPVLRVLGELCPFKYTEFFPDLESVAEWARANEDAVRQNSEKVDKLLSDHSLGATVSRLLAQTLHAWLMNTWWVVRPDGQNWFTVWEGTCYFHSTVDVEYTQTPFYLTVWPELLEMELGEWPHFAKDGKACLGERGAGTLFLSHDMGQYTDCGGQCYPHEMEVEENADYLLMAFAHWRRTGKDAAIRKHAEFIRKIMDFIVASDTTGNGIPDKGCANTIDDASPAIQFGSEQVYLGVKSLAACRVGRLMLEHAGYDGLEVYEEFAERALRTLESLGWKDDHYVVTLTRTLDGIVNPWSGQPMQGELEGWDAYHIYTANGLALLDMVGYDAGLSRERLRLDLENALRHTLGRYGCRHTSYVNDKPTDLTVPGLAGSAPEVGWISMNMLRDIAAAYRGLDLLSMAERYWDWQCTTNSQQFASFFETFYGNNLHFYPRGVAIFGYFDAAAGFAYDACRGLKEFSPVKTNLSVPLLLFADWVEGTAPKVRTMLNGDKIVYQTL